MPVDRPYVLEPRNKFVLVNRAIVESEIRPGNTVSFQAEVDLTEVERIRARAAGARRPSYTAFVVKAVALALKEFPYANRRVCRRAWLPIGGVRLQRFECQDVAVGIERDFPGAESTAFLDIIRDADRLPLAEITGILHELATCDAETNAQWRAFSGLIRGLPAWLAGLLIRLPCVAPRFWTRYRGGAVLVSSPAKYGVDVVLGSWPHPLGVSFGLVKPRAVVRDGALDVRTTFFLTLNFDRRVMAGAQAARFFRRIAELLEQAETAMRPYVAADPTPMASPLGAPADGAS